MIIYQVNLQTEFGGAEVYTKCLTEALLGLGVETRLIVNKKASFWQKLNMPQALLIPINGFHELKDALPKEKSMVVTNGWLPPNIRSQLNHYIVALAHMPLEANNPEAYLNCHKIIAVSHYVISTLKQNGHHNVLNEPLYGIVNPDLLKAPNEPIYKQSRYHWDKRKGRDWILSKLEPFYAKLAPKTEFKKRSGLTLGIVSRMTPIKQFPALLRLIAPVIVKYPELNLEIFGSGGYASVRDVKKALKPMQKQVRFWGQQWNVASIYRQMDYVLSGLPELEALGLNLLEAQACNTPVLAVNSAPFTETVVDGVSGFLYQDPRLDAAFDFEAVLTRILNTKPTLQTAQSSHLQQFTLARMQEKLKTIVPMLEAELNAMALEE